MKIAVIGSGISGLSVAYLLDKLHDVTVFEKNNYIGGHTRTIEISIDKKNVAVDTGFIVFNKKNYKNLNSMLNILGVGISKSNMSFGVRIDNKDLEYGTNTMRAFFAQKKNIFNPLYWKMVADILRFNKSIKEFVKPEMTLDECVSEMNLGEYFRYYYLYPMCGSIWSTPIKKVLDFSALSIIQFFDNHGLLSISEHPQWYTVSGGSKNYVEKIINKIKNPIKLQHEILSINKVDSRLELLDSFGYKNKFDQVIFACHSDQARSILMNNELISQADSLLSKICYQDNEIVVHSDDGFMPQRKAAWSSWIYNSHMSPEGHQKLSLTYWMNNLQKLNTKKNVFVTLNPIKEITAEKIYDKYTFRHPLLDAKAIKAQAEFKAIQGMSGLWFCGAWLGYGFHEDGLNSAINIAKKFNADIPWEKNV